MFGKNQGVKDERRRGARIGRAEEVFRDVGARMQAFAATDRAAAALLRGLGTDVSAAGTALIGLSNSIGVYGYPRQDAQSRVARALGRAENQPRGKPFGMNRPLTSPRPD
jgi:hypothetical protein